VMPAVYTWGIFVILRIVLLRFIDGLLTDIDHLRRRPLQ
jgi:hypothetical protein